MPCTYRVVWLGSNAVVAQDCSVHYHDDDDFIVMAALMLQQSLLPLLQFKAHDEVRAFAGPDTRYELTPTPLKWRRFWQGHDFSNKDWSNACRAWQFLLKNTDTPIVVTRYSASDIQAAR